ncbi:aldo/keto reductase [Caproiciproducens sp. MSJ-32]|uniref:aldo/keto reductase n=1 Tax=Caproiciproducens sp. MSJ-32 TaxID=2841527 RepID=UPI001C104754|nr:aldo/keto reductase [Caproiciproducens sp. MSJ-32]MBU5455533.1 aldo/keto reductase [Caproiciproducens sp. MSJ-32]
MKSLSDSYVLSNNVKIPCLGFGTWQTPDGEIAISSVEEAIRVGYRHIDTAAVYGNEESVGIAIKNSNIPREDIFVTTKVWNTDQGYDSTLKAFDESLRKLCLDYLDLYLIHWPVPKIFKDNWEKISIETWRAFEKLYKEGKVRAIGVSNFKPHHIQNLIDNCDIVPMVNQIQLHPGLNQEETVKYCRENNILVEAYSPLGTGNIFTINDLDPIAEKYNKTVAQVCLRWSLQKGHLPLPKSVTPSRILENTKIFDFELDEEDMNLIDNLNNNFKKVKDPDNINF